MYASNRFWMVIVIYALLFGLAGCKGAATETVVVETEPVATETETVAMEKTAICPLMNLKIEEGIKVLDSESGEVERMVINEWEFTCSDPYFNGKYIAIQDFYSRVDGSAYWMGYLEGVTDEGGVWKGTCENNMDGKMKAICTLIGDSKYKGLRLTQEFSIETGYVKYRITRMPED